MTQIVLLHGAMGSSSQMQGLGKLLEAHFEVFAFDFCGHGTRASEYISFSVQEFAADLDEFLMQKKISNPFIFGYSMGGYVALYHSLHFKNGAKKIFTLGTKFNWSPAIAEKEVALLDTHVMQTKIPKFVEVLKNRHGEKMWDGVVKKTQDMMHLLGNNYQLDDEDLANIKCRVVLMLADDDNMVTEEETEQAHDCIAHSEYVIIQNSKHPIEKVDLEELVKVILKF